jgi:hypothetical protein
MIQKRFRFRECEHNGDLDAYARDISRCGGKVVGRELDASAERGYLTVEFDSEEDYKAFWEKFKQTNSSQFC